jgi:hypothetical protein
MQYADFISISTIFRQVERTVPRKSPKKANDLRANAGFSAVPHIITASIANRSFSV